MQSPSFNCLMDIGNAGRLLMVSAGIILKKLANEYNVSVLVSTDTFKILMFFICLCDAKLFIWNLSVENCMLDTLQSTW